MPTLLLTAFLWLAFFLLVLFTTPSSPFLLSTFYLILFLALLLTSSLVLANTRAGFLISLGLIIFLILRQLKIANFLNLGLLLASLVSVELYLQKR